MMEAAPMDVDPPSQDDGKLPFPGKMVDGQFATEYIQIFGNLKKDRLVELCRGFGLPYSGNMTTLRERLKEFSGSREEWNRLVINARNTHLGPRNGKNTTAKSQKKSAQRREMMFENPADPFPKRRLPTILSTAVPEMRHMKHTATLQWASNIVKMYPYRPKEVRVREALEERQMQHAAANTHQADPSLKQGLETANTHLTKILSYVAAGSPPFETHANTTTTGDDEDRTLMPAAAASPSHLHTSPQTRSITLHDRVLTFTEDDVPPPPAVSFADDLSALNRMWDDSSAFWDNRSCLVIKGVPIALVHWRDVYTSKAGKSWKPNQWKGIKGKWFEWKVIVKRWRKGTPEQFWSEFSEDGRHLGYTAILAQLTQERTAEDRKLSEQAKMEFGNEFAAHFSYLKDGEKRVLSKASSVAKVYRRLKGMEEVDDV
jgi:hypothetical protein